MKGAAAVYLKNSASRRVFFVKSILDRLHVTHTNRLKHASSCQSFLNIRNKKSTRNTENQKMIRIKISKSNACRNVMKHFVMARATDLQVPFHPCKDGLFVEAAHGLEVESIHHIVDLDGLPGKIDPQFSATISPESWSWAESD
jgi:hypothetical protein